MGCGGGVGGEGGGEWGGAGATWFAGDWRGGAGRCHGDELTGGSETEPCWDVFDWPGLLRRGGLCSTIGADRLLD